MQSPILEFDPLTGIVAPVAVAVGKARLVIPLMGSITATFELYVSNQDPIAATPTTPAVPREVTLAMKAEDLPALRTVQVSFPQQLQGFVRLWPVDTGCQCAFVRVRMVRCKVGAAPAATYTPGNLLDDIDPNATTLPAPGQTLIPSCNP